MKDLASYISSLRFSKAVENNRFSIELKVKHIFVIIASEFLVANDC